MKWIALDLGSTHTKCSVIDSNYGVIRKAQLRTPPNESSIRTRYEMDAEAYYQLAYQLLSEALAPDIAGVVLSTQMHGYVLTDANFLPVSSFVSWQDRAAWEPNASGQAHLETLRAKLPPNALQSAGVPLKANLAMSMLYARMEMGEVIPAGTLFHTLGGYIIGRLTGKHVCHCTNASPTGMYNARTGDWDRSLIHKAGLHMLRFGKVINAYSIAGMWRNAGRSIPIMPDIGDHQVCVFSADLPAETGLHINIGTAGLIGLVTRKWSIGAYELRPWLTFGTYVQTVSGLPGGKHIDALETNAYKQIAQQYNEAIRSLGRRVDAVGFSGGCALHNTRLREEILNGIGVPQCRIVQSDVMVGMQRLTKMAEQVL